MQASINCCAFIALLGLCVLSGCDNTDSDNATPSTTTTVQSTSTTTTIATNTLSFLDIHSHIFREDQNLQKIVTCMQENGIEKICLSGFSYRSVVSGVALDDKIEQAYNEYPDLFIPFLRGFDLQDTAAPSYVREKLAQKKFKGIGELIINGHGIAIAADNKVLMEIYRIAGECAVPVLIHMTIGSNSENEPGRP
ncbi:MAG: hypothetical protein N3B18_04665, partial [Desulfobacterota bacterium]|nr:hypothetical protein [Thermodesulfobacteriota bacterium]